MMKIYEMIELWYINYIKHMNINIPDRYIDIDEVCKERAKKKMNLRCNKPDLEYPDVPDLYYRSVVEEMNKIKDKPITIDDLMKVNLSMIGMFEDYVIPKSKSDDKPNDTLGILK
jgi:hypothetical protein